MSFAVTKAPNFSHDCARCQFLGALAGLDFYACESDSDVSLVARKSSDGADYESASVMLAPMIAAHSPAIAMACDLYAAHRAAHAG